MTTVIPITDAMPAIAPGVKPCSLMMRGKFDNKPVRTITVTNITAPSSQNLRVRIASARVIPQAFKSGEPTALSCEDPFSRNREKTIGNEMHRAPSPMTL